MKAIYSRTAALIFIIIVSLTVMYAQDTLAVGDSILLSLDAEFEGTVQWEQSENNGISWEEIPGATGSQSMVAMPHYKVHFRARIQAEEGCVLYRSEAFMMVPRDPEE